MTNSIVGICNLALDELPAAQIVSISDNNQRAEVCRRQYPQALAELMELEWSFATRRASLTAITNTRSNLWQSAFVVPSDMGYPLRILNPSASYAPGPMINDLGLPFDFEGTTIWAQHSAVTLEYITKDPAFSDMSASFEKALYFTLAAKLAMPITKDRKLRDDLEGRAEVWRERAYAADLNKNARANRYGDNFIPEAIEATIGMDGYTDTAPVATVAPMAYDGLPET